MFMQKALALATSKIIQLLLKNKMNGLVELHQSLSPNTSTIKGAQMGLMEHSQRTKKHKQWHHLYTSYLW
jgi:hypothetical protein